MSRPKRQPQSSARSAEKRARINNPESATHRGIKVGGNYHHVQKSHYAGLTLSLRITDANSLLRKVLEHPYSVDTEKFVTSFDEVMTLSDVSLVGEFLTKANENERYRYLLNKGVKPWYGSTLNFSGISNTFTSRQHAEIQRRGLNKYRITISADIDPNTAIKLLRSGHWNQSHFSKWVELKTT